MRYGKRRALEEAERQFRLDHPDATVLVVDASFNAAERQLLGAQWNLMDYIDPPKSV